MSAVPGGSPAPPPRTLAALLCLWLPAALLATIVALRSGWPPAGELPTAEQVRHARAMAQVAGVVAVLPPACGLVLAHRRRSPGWTVTYLVGLMCAVLAAGLLLWITGSAVRR